MKLYKGYHPKNVSSYWIVTYDIPVNHAVSTNYVVSLSNGKKLLATVSNFKVFPELFTQVPIGISNETV